MPYLALGLIVFFGMHMVQILAPGFRARQIETFGDGGWKGIYSVVSLGGFALIILGWSIYRPMAPVFYAVPSWMHLVTALLVLAAFIFIAAAYAPAGRIKATLAHPFLAGIMLWAFGHLLSNGDLAGILVFGAFLLYAIWDRVSVAARGQAAPAYQGPRGDLIAITVGVVLFAVFALWLHAPLFGVSPLG